MQIRASVRSSGEGHHVVVGTDARSAPLPVPGRPGGGSSVNGGELLCLALATCYCNDVYREAARRGIVVRDVEVEVEAEFGGPGEPARRIAYAARVDGDATAAELDALLRHTDAVAEVHATLRAGIAVERRGADAVPRAAAPRLTSFAPQLLVDDLARSIAFYRTLGFTFGEPWDGFYAIGERDGLELHLKEAPKLAEERRHRRAHDHLDAAAGVDGIEAFYARCVASGVTVLRPLAATAWGTKDFYVEDPDGHVLAFGGRPAPGGAIVLAPHDDAWGAAFEAEASAIRAALPDLDLALHHVGSTAVPGIVAKPVIDMLAVVPDVAALDARAPHLAALGYEAKGEFGIPGRRYFRKDAPDGTRTHQLHAFAAGSPEAARHLDFRDYLRAHPDVAAAYAALKRELAARHGGDVAAYTEGKTAFVRDVERRAAAWRAGGARA